MARLSQGQQRSKVYDRCKARGLGYAQAMSELELLIVVSVCGCVGWLRAWSYPSYSCLLLRHVEPLLPCEEYQAHSGCVEGVRLDYTTTRFVCITTTLLLDFFPTLILHYSTILLFALLSYPTSRLLYYAAIRQLYYSYTRLLLYSTSLLL